MKQLMGIPHVISEGIANYIANEKNSEVGRVNLAALALLATIFPCLLVPSLGALVVRAIFKVDVPDWVWAIPVGGALFIAAVVVVCPILVMKAPPTDRFTEPMFRDYPPLSGPGRRMSTRIRTIRRGPVPRQHNRPDGSN